LSGAESALLGAYYLVLFLLCAYGLHRSVLVYLYYRHRRRRAEMARPTRYARVTVQLPVYNEMYVVDRLIESISKIHYPVGLLDIQVLDDSTDETPAVVRAAVARLRCQGIEATHHQRAARHGFKAGALADGMRQARGEFLLILDADFVAPPEILEQTLGHFDDPRVGMVQLRWGHINRVFSLLTQVQALLLDGHFVLEHGSRHRSGRFFNFNGTAGIWRRAAIEDAGGWQGDTLTEDLDLSYRAQLRGWRFVFVPDVVAPAEIPVDIGAFKTQQQRWARGSAQTCRKLLPTILASALPGPVKLEAALHLTANLSYPLTLLLALLMPPAIFIRERAGLHALWLVEAPLFLAATVSVLAFYAIAQREIGGSGWRLLRVLPAVLAVGVGLSVNNARAVIGGLLGRRAEFVRTPKHGVESATDEWRGKRYRSALGILPFVELAFGLYYTLVAYYAVIAGIFAPLPFLLLFQVGFLYTAALSFLHGVDRFALSARRSSGPARAATTLLNSGREA
jgi:cellulose synthase/poly-beta-1,6-N-acetylglucosamine synthase-like glycosyltransferase